MLANKYFALTTKKVGEGGGMNMRDEDFYSVWKGTVGEEGSDRGRLVLKWSNVH